MTSSLFDSWSVAVAALGLAVLVASFAFRTSWRAAIPITMELWTAAGLLRLAGEPSWARVATAAAIVAVSRLVVSRRVAGA